LIYSWSSATYSLAMLQPSWLSLWLLRGTDRIRRNHLNQTLPQCLISPIECTSNLVLQGKVYCKSTWTIIGINRLEQLSFLLPTFNLCEPPYCRHFTLHSPPANTNCKPMTCNLKLKTRNQEPETPNPKPQTLNPETFLHREQRLNGDHIHQAAAAVECRQQLMRRVLLPETSHQVGAGLVSGQIHPPLQRMTSPRA
jgi:hypothetical protein